MKKLAFIGFALISFNASAASLGTMSKLVGYQTIDFACQQRCLAQGMTLNYCTKICSY